jgi:hypothetical protein
MSLPGPFLAAAAALGIAATAGAAAVSLAAARPGEAGAPAAALVADDLATEPGLRRALDTLEARYETACRQVGAAVWQRWNGAGQEADAGEDRAWAGLAAVYADPLLDAVLSRWALKSTVTRDRQLTRRVRLWHTTKQAAAWTLDPEAIRLTRDLSRRLMRFPHTWKGRPATRAALQAELRTNPDRAQRKEAFLELRRADAAVREDLIRLVRMRAVRALDTRSGQVARLVFDVEQIEPSWLFQVVNRLGKRTQPAYDALLAGMREALRVDTLEPWDLDHALEARSRARWGGAPRLDLMWGESAAKAADRVLERSGLAGSTPVSRPLPAAFLLAPLSIPDDVRLLTDSSPDAFGLLRAHGRARLAASTRHESAMLKGYPWLPTARSVVYDEGMSAAVAAFLHDPLVLSRWLDLPAADAGLLVEDMKERALLQFRRLILEETFEYALYVNPDAELEGRYRELYRASTGTALPASAPVDWPGRLEMIEAPMSSLGRLLAPAMAAEVHALMAKKLGEQRLDPGAAGRWLLQDCMSDGERLPLGERLAACTERGYDMKLHFDWMGVGEARAR